MTPEQLAELRQLAVDAEWCRQHFEGRITARMAAVIVKNLPALLGMAERCADYDKRIGEVMPADFKDWHDNLPREWPEVAADTIKRLRGRMEQAERERDHLMHKVLPAMREQMARALEENKRLRQLASEAQTAVDCGCMCPSGRYALMAAIDKAKLRALDGHQG